MSEVAPEVTEETPEEGRMPLTEHLRELRTRLLHSAYAFMLAFAVCYYYSEPIFQVLQRPLRQVLPTTGTLAITSLAEGFMTHLRVGAIAAFFAVSPWLFYQLWKFVAPGLLPGERRLVIPFVFSASFLFLFGATFGYFVVFPFVFGFFIDETGTGVLPVLSISDFLSFSSKLLLLFGTIFELPVLSFFLARLGIISAEQMRKYRKYAVVGIFIMAAFITPPDPVSQTLIALPLICLYEVGIWVAKYSGRKPKPAEESPA